MTVEIEPTGDDVKLTLSHDGFESGSKILEGVRRRWPAILSSLKSLLETGHPLTAATLGAAAA